MNIRKNFQNQIKSSINFIFIWDAGEEHVMHWNSQNTDNTSYNDVNKVVINSLSCSRYQNNLQTLMKGS